MDYELVIDSIDVRKVLAHAETGLPLEAVALLFGSISEKKVLIKTINLIENDAGSRTEFSIDPVIQYKLLVEAEKRGEELVCVFHSHPAPPYPSSKDIRNMRLNPVVWLIASKITGKWEKNAYILNDNGDIVQVPIVLS